MWRSSYPDHLTAGCLVLDHTGDRVLLNLHRKARRWFAFGGHAEPGDATLADVARREAREESGIADLVFHPAPFSVSQQEEVSLRRKHEEEISLVPAGRGSYDVGYGNVHKLYTKDSLASVRSSGSPAVIRMVFS